MTLSKPAKEISLFDLVEAIEGSRWMNRCLLGLSECSEERACPTHAFWSEQRKLIEQKLKSISLADVSEFESRKNGRLISLDQVRKKLVTAS